MAANSVVPYWGRGKLRGGGNGKTTRNSEVPETFCVRFGGGGGALKAVVLRTVYCVLHHLSGVIHHGLGSRGLSFYGVFKRPSSSQPTTTTASPSRFGRADAERGKGRAPLLVYVLGNVVSFYPLRRRRRRSQRRQCPPEDGEGVLSVVVVVGPPSLPTTINMQSFAGRI